MAGYDNKGRFGAWRNKDRQEATHPHLTGSGEALDGSPCWLSAWFCKDLPSDDKLILADMIKRHEAASKKPFINISIKSKAATNSQGVASAKEAIAPNDYAQPVDDTDNDIPF